MIKMQKFSAGSLITLVTLILSCSTQRSPLSTYNTSREEFRFSYEKPFTRNLMHYNKALEYWQKPTYKEFSSHFPNTLQESAEHNFFFFPGQMQAGSRIELSIQFNSPAKALDYFETASKNYQQEFKDSEKYFLSSFCVEDQFACDSTLELKNFNLIRLLKPTYCVGQGDRKLGGIRSTIFLNKDQNMVICVAQDGR